MGVIIAVDVFPNRWVMLLDDSSGATIELTCRRENPSVPTNRVAALPENGMDARAVTSKVNQVGLTGSGRTVDLGGIDIGTVVKVKGGIGVFRGEKQVIIERICAYSFDPMLSLFYSASSHLPGDRTCNTKTFADPPITQLSSLPPTKK